MNFLYFLVAVAKLQGRVGGVFTRKQVLELCEFSPTTFYHYINPLMENGFIIRVKKGKYQISRHGNMFTLGMCLVTHLDFLMEIGEGHE